jgi:Family of unknown function (DUF5999)
MAALKPGPPLFHTEGRQMCRHLPACPRADDPDREAARTVAFHPEQGWSLLCNGLILFDDLGEILPDGRAHSRLPAAA